MNSRVTRYGIFLSPAVYVSRSAFAKAVKSVLPHLAIMPTGGITPDVDSLEKWFNAGVNCVGMGSQLFDKTKIKKSDFTGLQKDIAKAVNIASDFS